MGIFGNKSEKDSDPNQVDPKQNGKSPSRKGSLANTISRNIIENQPRTIFVNIPHSPEIEGAQHTPSTFVTNKIKTSKYTALNFFPKNLALQYKNIANFYFTALVILQCFSIFQTASPILNAAPIVIILCVTAIKDGVEDLKRHESDGEINHKPTYIIYNWHNYNHHADSSMLVVIKNFFHNLRKSFFKYFAYVLWSPYTFIVYLINLRKKKEELVIEKQPTRILPQDYIFADDAVDIKTETIELQAAPVSKNQILQSNRLHAGIIDETEASSDTPSFARPHSRNLSVDTESAVRKSLNRRSILSFRSTKKEKEIWKLMQWENVKVGDFVFLRDNDEIPADLIIISTSEPENTCFVETKNLDGETNLKSRVGNLDLAHLNTPELCASLKATIDVEPPNSILHSFNATMKVYGLGDESDDVPQSPTSQIISPPKQYPISINGILLRGCILRNTKWLIGIAVYTGADSRIMMNAGITPSKRSRIDRLLNPQVFVNFMVLSALCLVCATLSAAYQLSFLWQDSPWIGNPGTGDSGGYSAGYSFFLTFFLSMILFQNIIPIALVISVEGTKLVQSFFIFLDDDLKDPDSGRRCVPNCWNLCDDLGQIEYIFSDKTGTLTSNNMEFRKASINGVVYGGDYVTEAMMGAAIRRAEKLDSKNLIEGNEEKGKRMMETMSKLFDTKYVSPKLDFIDENIHIDIAKNNSHAGYIREFFTLLALCHTALIEKKDDEETGKKLYLYRSQSPDETALVKTAKDVGFAFLGKKDGNTLLDIMGTQRVYQLLNVLEFDSDRKRMSVLVRRPEGDIILLCKGADSVIYERLAPDVNNALKTKTSEDLKSFANEGLRTLCLAYRPISEEEYFKWNEEFKRAQALIFNRDEEVSKVSEKIEHDLVLMGATAIEDKLQDGVPETIQSLIEAGIKIWVLTGDKMETAINIGYACNLLKKESKLITIRKESELSAKEQIVEALKENWTSEGIPISDKPMALVIDGDTLKDALHKSSKQFLLELGCRCKAVICCRVSPLQKSQVVHLVRNGLGSLCLAIGDGANDVSMIQSADVGIGISGKEGMQAVMASDYSFGQFRFLKKLLLVHGRWAYIRTAEMAFNYFFKNGMFLFVLFWYQFDNAFSATFVIEYTFNVFYNTIFTILITLAIGTFDQDIDDKTLMKYPRLYLKGLQQTVFTMERFWLAIFDAIYQSVVIYYFGRWIFHIIAFRDGIDPRMDDLGTFLAWNIILLTNFNGAATIHRWSWIMFLAVILSILIWIIFCVIFVSTSTFSGTYGQQYSLLASGSFWFGFFLVTVSAITPKLLIKYVQRTCFPTDSDIIREDTKFIKGKLLKQQKKREKQAKANKHDEISVLDDDVEHNKSEISAPIIN